MWLVDCHKALSSEHSLKILRLFGKTLTADHIDSRHNWDKLPKQVQTSLSQKLKKNL